MECKLRCVNFRRVSDPRRAYLPAFRVTRSACHKPGSADDKPGSVNNKPGSTSERWRQTWERWRHVWEHLESQSCIQFAFSSMYQCIYIATLLHMLNLDWLRSAEYILPVTLSTSVTPVSPYNCRRSLKMYLIKRVWDALGEEDPVNSEMHLESGIERVWRCPWRPWSCKHAGRNQASLEIHLAAVIERVWRCTWRPWSREFRDTLGGHDRASLAEYLEAVNGRRAGTTFIG